VNDVTRAGVPLANLSIPLLDTTRLVLRPFEPGDAPAVQQLAGHRAVAATTLNIPHPYPDGAAQEWVAGHAAAAAAERSLTWAIVRRDGDLLMGAISMRLVSAHRRGDLGYWLGVPYWNQGFMTEAARRVIAFGFDELGLHRIQASALPRNTGSWRVMEKADMQREGVQRGYALKAGTFEDVVVYAVLRTDGGK
jgi:RimJ/RimL family protein N-acetyltransferase